MESVVRKGADRFAIGSLILCLFAGCNGGAKPPAVSTRPVIETKAVDTSPGVVELLSAKAVRNAENVVYFEVAYKFTSGTPIKNYMLNLGFPGTSVSGGKPMDAWEVKPEGIIKTGLPVADPELKTFEVTFSEADSPDRGYTVISNTLTGQVETMPGDGKSQ